MSVPDLAGEDTKKVSIYDCECGCFGCWPLQVRISKSENMIVWSDFEQPHRGPNSRASWWRYDKLGPFEFNREQYMAALGSVEGELRGLRRTNR